MFSALLGGAFLRVECTISCCPLFLLDFGPPVEAAWNKTGLFSTNLLLLPLRVLFVKRDGHTPPSWEFARRSFRLSTKQTCDAIEGEERIEWV